MSLQQIFILPGWNPNWFSQPAIVGIPLLAQVVQAGVGLGPLTPKGDLYSQDIPPDS